MNRIKAVSVLDPGNMHESMKVTNGEVTLGECSCNIEGLRYAWFYDSEQKAKDVILENPEKYWDLFVKGTDLKSNDKKYLEQQLLTQEIRKEEADNKYKGKWKVPGEPIAATRVPSDDFHSKAIVRAKFRFDGGASLIMMDKG